MVEMYVRLIKNSEEKGNTDWTLARVPEKYRAAVEIELQGGEQNG